MDLDDKREKKTEYKGNYMTMVFDFQFEQRNPIKIYSEEHFLFSSNSIIHTVFSSKTLRQ